MFLGEQNCACGHYLKSTEGGIFGMYECRKISFAIFANC
jgi:hypothetical protein